MKSEFLPPFRIQGMTRDLLQKPVVQIATFAVSLFGAFWILTFLLWVAGKLLNNSAIETSELSQDIVKLGTVSLGTWIWVRWTKYEFANVNQFNRTAYVWVGL